MTREKFPNQGLDKIVPLKFYYLDDEQELISITSQSDFVEALEIEDLSNLRLTVANNTHEARLHLERQIEDNVSMASSVRGTDPFAASFNNRAAPIGMLPRLNTASDLFAQQPAEDRPMTERIQNKFEQLNPFDMTDLRQAFEKTLQDAKNIFAAPSTAAETIPESVQI